MAYEYSDLISEIKDWTEVAVKEEWIEGETKLKTFVQNMGGTYDQKLFTEDFLAESECEVQYGHADERFRFTFVDIQGEVKNFEFYGKQ